MASDQGKSELIGEGLPGTGGDFVDQNDVEGHNVEAAPRRATAGARVHRAGVVVDRISDEDDVEGHLYRGGPTTQGGEFAKRGPGDNPHGER